MLDGVEVRAPGRQEKQAPAARLDFLAHGVGFVHAEVVHEHDPAKAQSGAEHPLQATQGRLRCLGSACHAHRAKMRVPLGTHGCQNGRVAPAVSRNRSVRAFCLGRAALAGGKRLASIRSPPQRPTPPRAGPARLVPAPHPALYGSLLAGGESLFSRVRPKARSSRRSVESLRQMPSLFSRRSQRSERSMSGSLSMHSRKASVCSGRRSFLDGPPRRPHRLLTPETLGPSCLIPAFLLDRCHDSLAQIHTLWLHAFILPSFNRVEKGCKSPSSSQWMAFGSRGKTKMRWRPCQEDRRAESAANVAVRQKAVAVLF
jgi:hypothetical protein